MKKKSEVSRVQKTPISYKFELNEEQKKVKAGSYEKAVSFILGPWGTGKTAAAVHIGLDYIFKRDQPFDKMILSRPIDFKPTGFLTGNMDEKMAFHIMPLKQNLYAAYGKEKIDKMFSDGVIQIIPIDYMKGMTFVNAIVIVDEFEDISYEDFKQISTRLGKGSKLFFTGDEHQTKKGFKESCMNKITKLEHSNLVNFHRLTINHRELEIEQILNYIENE